MLQHPVREMHTQVSVMAPEVRSFLSPSLTSLSDIDLDLASDLIGCQVPNDTPTVKWSDGRTTILPCVLKDGIDLCANNDAIVVQYLAQLPESTPKSTHVVHLQSRDYTAAQLRERVSAALRDDKPVIIRADDTPKPPSLDAEYLEDEFGISPYMLVDIHGQFLRFM
jgi:hypothetical protein